MNNKYKVFIVFILSFTMLLTACGGIENTGEEQATKIEELNHKIKELTDLNEGLYIENQILLDKNEELEIQQDNVGNYPNSNNTQNLIDRAYDVMGLIKDKNMAELSTYVHPIKGLRFTPYVYINLTFDQVFSPGEVAVLDQNTTEYNWGYYYVSVEQEIIKTFNDYYDEFIYDEDFLNTNTIGVNAIVSYGDIIDNIDNEYPNAEYLEFYFPGVAHNNGSYWRSLKLVFEESGGQLYLIGIVHGQWTDQYGI